MKKKIIEIKDLTISFKTNEGMVRAVRGISYDLYQGETLAIVGESGSGKSVSSRAVMGILAGNAIIDKGEIIYHNQDLTKVSESMFHEIRGSKIGMIFQDPMSALNPIMRIGKQITEGILVNGKRLKKRKINLYEDAYNKYKAHLLSKKIYKDKYKNDLLENKENSNKIKEIKSEYKEFLEKHKNIEIELKKVYKEKEKKAKEQISLEYIERKEQTNNKVKELKEELNSADLTEEKEIIKKKIEEEKESFRRFVKVTKKEAYERAIAVMEEVGIPEPEKRFKQYPFQFSGGMRQRIVIAIALTASPEVLICDEPTTALDVTIQAQILDLIKKLKTERNLSVIFITHDLGVVANMADRVAVMYAGKIVEYGNVDEIFYNPKHPYTWALLSSMPDLNTKEKLNSIPGTPPNMLFPPKGDSFAERNKYAMKIDFEEEPPFFKITDTHYAATWLLHKDAPKIELPAIIKERIDLMKKDQVERGDVVNGK